MCSLRARKVPACARALANKHTFKENKIQNYTLDTGFPSGPRYRRPSERGVRPLPVDSGLSVADVAAASVDRGLKSPTCPNPESVHLGGCPVIQRKKIEKTEGRATRGAGRAAPAPATLNDPPN